jgi:hypothetical protein
MTTTTFRRASREELLATGYAISVATVGVKDGGCRIDWRALDTAERDELHELTERAQHGGHWDLGRLDKRQRERWEALVELGANSPGIFAERRQLAEIARKAAQVAVDAAKRPFKRDEAASIFGEIAEHLKAGYLNAPTTALLVILIAAFESGEPPREGSYFSGTGVEKTLHFDGNLGLISGRLDPEGVFARWRYDLEHLERNGWVRVAKRGRDWTLTLGPRTRRLIAAPAKAKARKP